MGRRGSTEGRSGLGQRVSCVPQQKTRSSSNHQPLWMLPRLGVEFLQMWSSSDELMGWALLQLDWGPYKKRGEQGCGKRPWGWGAEPREGPPPAQHHPEPPGLEGQRRVLPWRVWVCQHLGSDSKPPEGCGNSDVSAPGCSPLYAAPRKPIRPVPLVPKNGVIIMRDAINY